MKDVANKARVVNLADYRGRLPAEHRPVTDLRGAILTSRTVMRGESAFGRALRRAAECACEADAMPLRA